VSDSSQPGTVDRSTADPAPAKPRRRGLRIQLALFLATCLTTTWVGVLNAHPEITRWLAFGEILPRLLDGIPYAASLMGILVAHEMGHYVFARWHRVPASLPYFIPIPLPPVGTMGAVIKMEGRIGSRNALADIGASGPLAGLVVAIPVLAYGIHLSPVRPIGPGLLEGSSLLYFAIKLLVKGAILPGGGKDVVLHPIAWAGWVGLLVTMINLMPIGQLDGGHVAFAYFGDRYRRLSGALHRGLPLLALAASSYAVLELHQKASLGIAFRLGWMAGLSWLVWWGMLQLIRRASGGQQHPPVGEEPLSRGRRLLCLLMIVVFFLILIPIPIRATL
jgi:membrane-associated protease RseP (regulator of RpoE activity)